VSYLLPDDDIIAIVDAPPTPAMSLSPDGRHVLLVHYEAHPPITLVARPFLKLGGVRVDPVLGGRQRLLRLVGLTLISVADGAHRVISLPPETGIGIPSWSPDSRRFVFLVDGADRVVVWLGNVETATAEPIPGLVVSDVLTGGQTGGEGPVRWSRDSRSLLALTALSNGVDELVTAPVIIEPHIEETEGKTTQMATFQDLLTSRSDEDTFEALATAQLARIDPETGNAQLLGEPGLLSSFGESPDGRHILVHRVQRPFSFRVPFVYFARTVEVWSSAGDLEAVIADLPVSDEIPRQGVPTGPRRVSWEERKPASLMWIEALDDGDPMTAATHRDRIIRCEAPFTDPAEATRIEHRCLGWYELDQPGALLAVEHDRDRRWRITRLLELDRPASSRVLFDLSMNDAYGNPGTPLFVTHPDGTETVLQMGSTIFLRGQGATPEGDRPFLDRFDLTDGSRVRLHASPAGGLEPVLGLVDDGTAVLVRRETRSDPPNLVVVPINRVSGNGGSGEGSAGVRRVLTDFADPHPQLTTMSKQLRTHHRSDGVALTGLLLLPPDHDVEHDGRLPLVVWAYPLEYSDAGTAGQMRGSDQGFTRLGALGPIWFVLRGYAVLLDATMPVIGDPETMNDTYIDQVTDAARAHIEALDADGIIDPGRVIVGGHSYGGFMTANLLAHTDLFAAGIARSGAYNRSLTPFGFQSERRTFWEAPHIYDAVSPFRHADKIRTPLLLIHGAADNNPGTFTVQSERLFQALQGTGGTARLVLLPHESHGYVARESVLHVLAEQFAWAQRWAPANAASSS